MLRGAVTAANLVGMNQSTLQSVHQYVLDNGGALPRRDLPFSSRTLTRAVRSGAVRRARRGWYTTFTEADPRFVALRVGGRLTGIAALVLLGAWTWQTDIPLAVSVPRNAARLRRAPGVRVVHDRQHVVDRGDHTVVDARDALRRALLDSSFEAAVALWDWARRSSLYSVDDLREVLDSLPADARGVATWSDAESQSVLESVARVRYIADGHHVEAQVAVSTGQSIDLVVDGVVAVELDGREFHQSTFEADRTKDLAIAIDGKMPLRMSSTMVRHAWDQIRLATTRAVQRHLGDSTAAIGVRPLRRVRPRGRRPWRCRVSPAAIDEAHLAAPRGRLTSSEVRAQRDADAMSSLARAGRACS